MRVNKQKINDYSATELSMAVWMGLCGNGSDRKNFLGSRYAEVQDLVEKQASTGVIEPGEPSYDLEKLTKAVESTYAEAAQDLISEIKKEAKK